MDFHFLDHEETYQQCVVFGRDALIELLWERDRDLRRSEQRSLKENPAYWMVAAGNGEPGFLLLSGRRLRVSLPLRYPGASGPRLPSRAQRTRWLRHYAQGLNVHNRFSSFLDARSAARWARLRVTEPREGASDGFADFAESWASLRVDPAGFTASYPGRRAFVAGLRGLRVSRKLKSLDPRIASRRPGRAR